jgi:hypothetical protein
MDLYEATAEFGKLVKVLSSIAKVGKVDAGSLLKGMKAYNKLGDLNKAIELYDLYKPNSATIDACTFYCQEVITDRI